MRHPPDLARCPTDGAPLLLVVYGGVVMVGCELCDRVDSYSPRETFEPPAAPAGATWLRIAPPTCYAEAVRAYALRAHETAPSERRQGRHRRRR